MTEETQEETIQAEKVVSDELAAIQAAADKVVKDNLAKDAAAKKEPEIIPEETQKAEDLISKANTAAIRQEDANKELKVLIDRQEMMKVEETLGGKAEAGSKATSAEEKEIASTKEFLKGTGYEDELFPKK